MWSELKFPPINLWNLPKQYRDVSDDDIAQWVEIYEEYKDIENVTPF